VTAAERRGHAFGFHRMMDNFGGVLGPMLAFGLLHFAKLPLQTVFAASLIPGLLSVLVVLVFVRDPFARRAEIKPAADLRDAPAAVSLSGATWRYLGVLAVFSLAGSGDLFLLKRLSDLGLREALIPVAWVSLQLAKGLMNVPGGRASDRFGRRRILSISWVIYAVTYAIFGWVTSWATAWLCLGLYAVYYGLAEGGQRALLAEYVPAAHRGRAYGYQLAIEGGMLLGANLLFGFLYDRWGAPTAFAAAGTIALTAAALLITVVPSPERAATVLSR
jgi:MFS family permease